MGYLIPVTPQAFVNRISIERWEITQPDEANIKEISYQLSLHFTIPINIFTPPKSLELYIAAVQLTEKIDWNGPAASFSLAYFRLRFCIMSSYYFYFGRAAIIFRSFTIG